MSPRKNNQKSIIGSRTSPRKSPAKVVSSRTSSNDSIEVDLIEAVKQYPVLYDKSEDNYKQVTVKKNVWETIGKKFNITGDDAKVIFFN